MTLKEKQFYCVACRGVVTAKACNICVTNINNSRTGKIPALRAKCRCGTTLTKFMKKGSFKDLACEYGQCKLRKSKSRRRRSKSRSRSRSRSRC